MYSSVINKLLIIISLCFVVNSAIASDLSQKDWVDSVYNNLTPNERLAQLFMVAAYSGGENYNKAKIDSLITNHLIGGLIFMQGTPTAQAKLTNTYQTIAQVPLLIGMDAEWGLGMRLTGVDNFPRQMMLGATDNTSITYDMGAAIARQCKRLGVHIDFAPDIDINNNPNNPVINFRSFGERKEMVAKLGIAYMKGLQDNGIIACAKHFPGHGDVSVDSHLDLPIITKSLDSLEKTEFFPFKKIIEAGVQSVMIAHLNVPAIDPTPNLPTTLSYNAVTNILKKQLGFKGLIITDALNMKGVTKNFPDGETDLRAFLAGNDILLFSQNVSLAITKIDSAIQAGAIDSTEVEARVKKVLTAKYKVGLSHWTAIDPINIDNDINAETNNLSKKIAEQAITLVQDPNKTLENLNKNPKKNIVYVGIGVSGNTSFENNLRAFFPNIAHVYINKYFKNFTKSDLESIQNADYIIVGAHELTLYPKNNYGYTQSQITALRQLSSLPNSISIIFGNAYAYKYIASSQCGIVTYEDNDYIETLAARVVAKKFVAKGKLPVTPGVDPTPIPPLIYNTDSVTDSSNNQAITTNSQNTVNQPNVASNPRFVAITTTTGNTNTAAVTAPKNNFEYNNNTFTHPEYIDALNKFIYNAIAQKAFPGCQIVALKDGKQIFNKAYGTVSYMSNEAVNENTLYDIASVTKIAATTLAVMKLYEEHKLDLNATLGNYLPITKGTNKESLKISDILLHQAGLKSWIPFYKTTLDANGQLKPEIYYTKDKGDFSIPVAAYLYMNKNYVDTMWQQILTSPLNTVGHYEYSDLDFYFLKAVVEKITGKAINDYVQKNFYSPMGLKNILYNPWQKGWINNCAPTENDKIFRQQIIQGYVHDPGAAMLGGVAGHAGIFATAQDLGQVMQMLLNGGQYNGKQLLQANTINLFTNYHSSSRRGYGFDKPDKSVDDGGPASVLCSKQTFGHQGFTGTCAWADPKTGIVFIFLSNRVNPSADNNLINKMNVRTTAQDYIYKALGY